MPRYSPLPNSSSAHDKQPSLQKVDSDDSSTSSTSPPFAWQAAPVDKLLLICASILPLLASTTLLVTTVTDRSSIGPLLSFVLDNRSTTQIGVSIVSAVLACLNVYTVTKLLNFATRIHLLRQSLSLPTIEFIRAISTRSLVAGVPITISTTAVIIVVVFALPNVLWTGALTPVLTNATIVETKALKIPQYSASSNTTWSYNNRLGHGDCNTVTNTKGVFSNCPVSIIQSSLLSRAAQATSNLTLVHAKSDNSHYSFVGRSYGVGSPAGLVDENLYSGHGSSKLLSYNYTEPGYLAHVTCFYNASSDFHLKEIQPGKLENGIPYIYYAIGAFPNAVPGQSPDFFAVVGVGGDVNTAVIAAKRYEGRNVILVTAGSSYIDLNSTQCEVSLAPTQFTVSVDVANKFISVMPINKTKTAGSAFSSFDSTAGLARSAMDQLNGLGMISTTLYTSVIGDALMSNIRATTNNSSSLTTFAAMADSFSAMLDDLLLMIGSSQFFVPDAGAGDFFTVDAHLTVQAVRVGEAKYVFAVFAICVVLLFAVAAEAFRTRVWRWLPRWDFMDATCLVLASAVAGEDVVGEMCRGRGGTQMKWTGGGGQDEVSEFRLRLGWKELRAAPAQQARNGSGGTKGEQDVQLAAVSLWPSNT